MHAFRQKTAFVLLLVMTWTIAYASESASDSISHSPEEYCSGTLPVMYIVTDSLKPVVSKDYYLTGTYYLDANGFEGVEPIGTAEEPLPLSIKGRGNASWKLDKKPYKIKLDKKASLMGLPKSKQFALMAHYEDHKAFLKDESGFELSRRLGMSFTPRQEPIELVLNGDYAGIYFVTQNIKVDNDRVNIVEQADSDTVATNVTGGWLVELDNYADSPQFAMPRDNTFRITIHSPEVLSDEQWQYITGLYYTVDSLISNPDKGNALWTKYIDIDTLARFYIINEILENVEAFNGSCWMHKERGEDSKIIFGPVWDFGSAFGHPSGSGNGYWLFEDEAPYAHNKWIKDLFQYPAFQREIRRIWTSEYDNIVDGLDNTLQQWATRLIAAGFADHNRWPESAGHDIAWQSRSFISKIDTRIAELDGIWNIKNVYDFNKDGAVDVDDMNILINRIIGFQVNAEYDVTFDKVVDVEDLNAFINYMLKRQTTATDGN